MMLFQSCGWLFGGASNRGKMVPGTLCGSIFHSAMVMPREICVAQPGSYLPDHVSALTSARVITGEGGIDQSSNMLFEERLIY